jgi:pimeloyl-ACP methyl ester carboxylesterase
MKYLFKKKDVFTSKPNLILAFLFVTIFFYATTFAQKKSGHVKKEFSDEVLVKSLPGFENKFITANGIQLHYVKGGTGEPLILLPGWPQTWWEYHKMMPALAKEFTVISVDLRGMGKSSRPASGYDKKTMAKDIYEMVKQLGYSKVNIAGHDIGSMVAFSYAANYPDVTTKLALMDVPHPDALFGQLRMLPEVGKFAAKIDDEHPGYPWWFAFHQVKGLPETILEGRSGIYIDFLLDYLSMNSDSINAKDRAIYKAVYAGKDALRAGDAWYQTFPQDMVDMKTYSKLTLPVLGLGSTGYGWLQAAVTPVTTNFKLVKVENSGHFMPDEQPAFVAQELIRFFK